MKWKIIKYTFWIALFTLSFSVYVYWRQLDTIIEKTLSEGWFAPSLQYYSAPTELRSGQKYSLKKLISELKKRNYIEEQNIPKLSEGEYVFLNQNECLNLLDTQDLIDSCIVFKNKKNSAVPQIVAFQKDQIFLYQHFPATSTDTLFLDPILFAGSEYKVPLLRSKFVLNEVPYLCLQAITLIEDHNFLLHTGVSFKGIMRAVLKNLMSGQMKEGGSTITQQLIKNRFLSFEKTLRRKWTEWLMALLLENKISKDKILELYLNTIYMGTEGTYNFYGFSSAAKMYFNKPLKSLDAAECSLLAAIVQSPGRMSPFKNSERSKQRRDVILTKMYESKEISQKMFRRFTQKPLPKKSQTYAFNQGAPYFIDAVYKELKNKKIKVDQNLKIYTTLDLTKQEMARNKINVVIKQLDKRAGLQKELEVSLILVDLKTNDIVSLIGGRRPLHRSFNRALDARRPIGSLIKPVTYLSALIDDSSLHPLTEVIDQPFSIKSWSPKNYKDRYYGKVPLYFALSQSLNTASARIGRQIGFEKIINTLQTLGWTKDALAVPSITLGAIDMSPKEITQVYTTLARMGSYKPLSIIRSIETTKGEVLYQNRDRETDKVSPTSVAVVVGMLKQVIQTGTASWIHPFWKYPTAGKTGTSNEERDSWFIGFTPRYLASVWIGYDDNTPHKLSGAAGALPLWLRVMQSLDHDPEQDFTWPQRTKTKTFKAPLVTKLKRSRGKTFYRVRMDETSLSSKENKTPFYKKVTSLFTNQKTKKSDDKKEDVIDLIFDDRKSQWFDWL